MKTSLCFLSLFFLFACQEQDNSDKIINQAIEYAGGSLFNTSDIAFEFRNRNYQILQGTKGTEMTRSFSDSLGKIVDSFREGKFERKRNDSTIEVPDSMAIKYIESINSVCYFALLPYKLNDPAVIKSHMGFEVIDNKNYHKIKVTFQKEGGGIDFEDEFIYWFDQENYRLDYLAYRFQVNGGGLRFRKAYNKRRVGGIQFADYENYKADKNEALENLASKWQEGKLEFLSKIELESLSIIE